MHQITKNVAGAHTKNNIIECERKRKDDERSDTQKKFSIYFRKSFSYIINVTLEKRERERSDEEEEK
jgi:hypothetical protein